MEEKNKITKNRCGLREQTHLGHSVQVLYQNHVGLERINDINDDLKRLTYLQKIQFAKAGKCILNVKVGPHKQLK